MIGVTTSGRNRTILIVLLAVVIVAIIVAFSLTPIKQDPAYHSFADQRRILGVQNFWNVFTNLPFLIIGWLGLQKCANRSLPGGLAELRSCYVLFFTGIILTGLGSGLYHYSPTIGTLVWDRLPLTIAVMAFVCAIIGENISPAYGKILLWPFIAIGLFSVLYWYVSETRGQGDLRPYGLVQFLPMIIIPILLLFTPPRFTNRGHIWGVLAIYAGAKVAEALDETIYRFGALLSGHSLKHLLAATAAFLFLIALGRRHSRASTGCRGVADLD